MHKAKQINTRVGARTTFSSRTNFFFFLNKKNK